MKNAVFWDVAPCRYYVTRRFGVRYRLHLLGRKIRSLGTSCGHLLTLIPRSRIVYPEVAGDTLIRNVGSHKIYTAPHTRRWYKGQVVYPFLINTYIHIKDECELLSRFQRCFCLRLQDQTLNETSSQSEAVARL
jgi:hypothetical protein